MPRRPHRREGAGMAWHQGALFHRAGFVFKIMTSGSEAAVQFYNGFGASGQWIKEGTCALNRTRLSRHRFVVNRVRQPLFILAHNLGNFIRRLCLPKAVKRRSLRNVRESVPGDRLVYAALSPHRRGA